MKGFDRVARGGERWPGSAVANLDLAGGGFTTSRRGMVTVYAIVLLTALTGFVSLAVDLGRVQLVKTELQHAADAASRAAAAQLSNGVTATQNAAVAWGGYNNADGTPVVIDSTNDVDFLTWDSSTRTYTVLTGSARSSANAVRVTARRTAARGTAVSLYFGKVIGLNTCDATSSAIALSNPGSADFGFVGLSGVTVSGSTSFDGYDSGNGSYGGSNVSADGALGSNGNVSLGSSGTTVTVNTDLYMKNGKTLTTAGTVSYGTRQAVSGNLTWPTPSAGTYATSNDNWRVGLSTTGAYASYSYGTYSVPPGHYYLNSLDISGGTLTFTGPTVIYMNGPFSMSGGSFVVSSGKPSDLQILFVTATTMTVGAAGTFKADVQGPTTSISISGNQNFYGRLIGSTLSISGGGNYHFDTNLVTVSGASQRTAGTGGAVSTVK